MSGKDVDVQDVRTYRISRIQKVHRSAEKKTFLPPEDFDAETYLKNNVGAWGSEQIYELEIIFDDWAAPYVQEQFINSTQTTELLPDAKLRFKAKVNHLIDVKDWVLGWGMHAEVVKPDELKVEIKENARKMGEMYHY